MSKWRTVSFLLVLMTLLLCPAAEGRPLLDVNNPKDVFQAEEHSKVTLTLLLPVNSTSDLLYIDLMRMASWRRIYWYDSRTQDEPYTDDVFRGRLQCDTQLVGNGELKCVLTDLRLSDAGLYQWNIGAEGRSHLKRFELVVRDVMQQTPEDPPKETQRGRVGVLMAFCLFAVVLGVFLIRCAVVKFHNSNPDPPDVK